MRGRTEVDDGAGLPDPLCMNDGTEVKTPEQWRKRREEMTAILLDLEYGHMPPAPGNVQAEDICEENTLDGSAVLRRCALSMCSDAKLRVRAGLVIPKSAGKRLPVILAVEPVWASELERPARLIIEAGYAFAGFEKQDFDRDDADRSDGPHPLYPECDWATLAVWAWGCMRLVDFLCTQEEVDAEQIALTGHSRAGKTALLAGALDDRIALTAPHCSGAGGAGLYRIQNEGAETLAAITDKKRFHYWFHPRLADYAGRENELPFDQHFLHSLVAPRGLVSLEALDDHWANPLGAQHAYVAARRVYEFLGAEDRIGVHFHPGGHDVIDDDWIALLQFADHVFFGKRPAKKFDALPFAGKGNATGV